MGGFFQAQTNIDVLEMLLLATTSALLSLSIVKTVDLIPPMHDGWRCFLVWAIFACFACLCWRVILNKSPQSESKIEQADLVVMQQLQQDAPPRFDSWYPTH